MRIKGLVAVALCALCFSAAAQFRTIAPAYEVLLSNFRPPETANGGVAFRQCGDCEMQQLPVTSSTVYVLNGQSVVLKEFREALISVDNRESVTVMVMHHLESDTVIKVSVTI